MSLIGVTQRVAISEHGERRDALDQRWASFLALCGHRPLPLPNDFEAARELVLEVPLKGLLLTGGNDLSDLGGDAPERDRTELVLLDLAQERGLPVLGVCRGLQLILHRAGAKLEEVEGYVAQDHPVRIGEESITVNSYHNWGTRECPPPLEAWAKAEDGVIEAVRDPEHSLQGIMWHPERMTPFSNRDLELFRSIFG